MTGILEENPWKQDQIMPWMVNVTEYPVKTMTEWRDILVWTKDPSEEIIAQCMDLSRGNMLYLPGSSSTSSTPTKPSYQTLLIRKFNFSRYYIIFIISEYNVVYLF